MQFCSGMLKQKNLSQSGTKVWGMVQDFGGVNFLGATAWK
jgi:hypothetical protein